MTYDYLANWLTTLMEKIKSRPRKTIEEMAMECPRLSKGEERAKGETGDVEKLWSVSGRRVEAREALVAGMNNRFIL
jgi:hypothetical protein